VTGETVAVAVIIPARDAAGFVDQALASVAGQSRPPTEVVVSDDGSTDDTADAVERWNARLHIHVLRNEVNAGPSVARNQAISYSTSPLVALLDADDVWLPDHLATLVAVWDRHRGLAMADCLGWIPGEGITSQPWSNLVGVPPPENQLRSLYYHNFIFTGCLFAREDFERAGRFRTQFRGAEDWDLWIRMLRNGVRVTAANHPTVLYRLREGSASSVDRFVDDKIAVLEAALAEAHESSEKRAVRAGLRRLRAEQHLFRAYQRSTEGRISTARLHGLAALAGSRRVGIRGLAMGVAPRATARRRAAIHTTPTGRLRQW
jgi:glycosyltransferase involved in cell wall biosynthesis